jgi:hypothetical protein
MQKGHQKKKKKEIKKKKKKEKTPVKPKNRRKLKHPKQELAHKT